MSCWSSAFRRCSRSTPPEGGTPAKALAVAHASGSSKPLQLAAAKRLVAPIQHAPWLFERHTECAYYSEAWYAKTTPTPEAATWTRESLSATCRTSPSPRVVQGHHAADGEPGGVRALGRFAPREIRIERHPAPSPRRRPAGFCSPRRWALQMKKPLIPLRKPGKLPGATRSCGVRPRIRVGGTARPRRRDYPGPSRAARRRRSGDGRHDGRGVQTGGGSRGVVVGCAFLIELSFLKGRALLANHNVFSLITY